jgi:hypothetical protein
MRVAALVELVVDVAHGLRLAATQHHLHVNRLKTVVLIAVDHACGRMHSQGPSRVVRRLPDSFSMNTSMEPLPTGKQYQPDTLSGEIYGLPTG